MPDELKRDPTLVVIEDGQTPLDKYMDKLRANPRFKVIEDADEGFIIGGQSPAHPKPSQATETGAGRPPRPEGASKVAQKARRPP
jgi:hypothetical protein